MENLFSKIVHDLGTARTVVLIFASLALFILIAVNAVKFIVDILNPFEIKGSGIFAIEPAWTFETDETIVSTPVIYGDTIILHTEKKLYALNASTREVLWTSNSPGSIYGTAPPIIVDDIVVAPEGTNPFAAFDLASGELLWRNCYLRPGQQECSQAPERIYIGDLQSEQGVLLVSNFSGELTAYDMQSGSQLWQIRAPGRGGPSVAVDNGTVYLDQHTSESAIQLWAVDLKSGALQWHMDMDDVMGKLVARDGILYYSVGVGNDAYVAAITGDGATVLWDVRVDGGGGSKFTYLGLDDNTLFVTGNQLTAISIRDGTVIWRTGVRSGFMRPVVFGDMVLVRDQHLLYAFDKHTGKDLGRLSLEIAPGRYNMELNAAVYGDLVLVPVGAKQLAAYRLEIPNPSK